MNPLQRFLLALDTPREFRDWLYKNFEQLERELNRDDFLALLELDFSDGWKVSQAIASLRDRVVPSGDVALADRLVLADQLQAAGDPRGELIMLQANLQSSGTVAVGESELLERHRERLLGPLAEWVASGVLRLDWHLGFVARATLRVAGREDGAEILRALLVHPSSAGLRELRVGPASAWAGRIEAMVRVLAETPTTITALELRSDFQLDDLSGVFKTQVNLQSVELYASCGGLGPLPPPCVSFVQRLGWIRQEDPARLASSDAALLERLELWVASEPMLDPADIAPILLRDWPRLRHLSLVSAPCSDELVDILLASNLLPQLATLDLSRGNLSRAGATRLLTHARALAHLDRLNLRYNELERDVCDALAKALPNARVREQTGGNEIRRDLSGEPWW